MSGLRCACGGSVAAHLAAIVAGQAATRKVGAASVALAGFPFTGKTSLARDLAGEWAPNPSVILPTETFIAPRDVRRSLQADGCSPRAHDMIGLASAARNLRHHRDVEVDVYSWRAGRHLRQTLLLGLPRSGLLIVDGSVSCEECVAQQCDLVVFLRPTDLKSWIGLSAHRDVCHRAWSLADAQAQNLDKRATVEDQYRRRHGCITCVISIEFGAADQRWTARLAECAS